MSDNNNNKDKPRIIIRDSRYPENPNPPKLPDDYNKKDKNKSK